MTSTKNVQNAHISQKLRELHRAVLDIVAMINIPERDDIIITEAAIQLDRALFPLLVRIERLGPIGVNEVAGQLGRDHTTVSRQIARLEQLGLVARRSAKNDGRVREATVTDSGKAMTDRIDQARERLSLKAFAQWEAADLDDLVRLMRKYADTLHGSAESRN